MIEYSLLCDVPYEIIFKFGTECPPVQINPETGEEYYSIDGYNFLSPKHKYRKDW